jgi:hypothetical protein
VAQVIEAINLFLAGEFPNCIFVLAMEPEIVAAHVEVANAKLVDRLSNGVGAGEWTTLGWRFLDKIVQLPMSIPEPDAAGALDPFLDEVLGHGAEPPSPKGRVGADQDDSARTREPRPSSPPPDKKKVDRIVVAAGARGADSIAGLRDATRMADAEVGGGTAPPGQRLSREAAIASRLLVEGFLSERNKAVRNAIQSGIELLGPRNPRQVKRFVNLFRFYAFIETMRSLNATNGETAAELGDIAKVAALAIRWPSLVSTLTRKVDGHDMLEALETTASDDQKWTNAVTSAGLLGKNDPVARMADLRTLLRNGPSVAQLAARLL